MSGICVLAFPFCYNYVSFVIVALFLGLFVSAFISLTSIVLVDLLGLDSLTSSFGMLRLCTGIASILGTVHVLIQFINRVYQQGSSTGFINRVYQKGLSTLSTRFINRVYQQGSSPRFINRVYQQDLSTGFINRMYLITTPFKTLLLYK